MLQIVRIAGHCGNDIKNIFDDNFLKSYFEAYGASSLQPSKDALRCFSEFLSHRSEDCNSSNVGIKKKMNLSGNSNVRKMLGMSSKLSSSQESLEKQQKQNITLLSFDDIDIFDKCTQTISIKRWIKEKSEKLSLNQLNLLQSYFIVTMFIMCGNVSNLLPELTVQQIQTAARVEEAGVIKYRIQVLSDKKGSIKLASNLYIREELHAEFSSYNKYIRHQFATTRATNLLFVTRYGSKFLRSDFTAYINKYFSSIGVKKSLTYSSFGKVSASTCYGAEPIGLHAKTKPCGITVNSYDC